MKVRPFLRYNLDDYSTAPSWFQTFLSAQNVIVDQINPLIQGGIDTTYNITAERRQVTVQHNKPVNIKMQALAQTPSLVRAGYAQGQIVTGCSITSYNSDGTVGVTVLFNGAPSGSFSVLLVFEP